jgi:hypothetical protein
VGRKIAAISLVLVMVLSFAACAKEPSTQEIIDGTIQSMYQVNTYQFEMDMTMDMTGEAEGEAFEMTMTMDSSGAIDNTSRRMRIEMLMDMTMPEEDDTELDMEMYLIGNTAYILADIPDMGDTWMKSRVPVGTWDEMAQVEPQIELLESAEVKLIGSEKVRGVDCYVLQVTPDLQKLWQIAMQQQNMTGGEALDIPEEAIQGLFRSISVRYWIEKDTYYLARSEMEMSLEITPEDMGYPEEEGIVIMDMYLTLLAYNYNETVSIVVPAEAEDAIEVPWD